MPTPWQTYVDEHLPEATTAEEKTAAIQGALDLVPAQVSRPRTVPQLRLPYGVHELEADSEGVCLRLKHPTELHLDGACLVVPDGAVGVFVPAIAQGSLVASGGIVGELQVAVEADENAGVGIHAECSFFRCYDVTVTDLGIGVELYGVGGGTANVDFARVSRLISWRNHVGLRIVGGDSQGGFFDGCIFYHGGIGIENMSFLGNTFTGCAFHTTQAEAVLTTYYGADAWLGCWAEGDCGADIGGIDNAFVISPYAATAGGNFPLWVHAGDRMGMGISSIGFRAAMADGSTIQVTIPHGGAKTAIDVQRALPSGTFKEAHRLRWDDLRHLFGWESITTFSGAIGLHMGLAVTNSDHPKGIGHAVHDSTLEAPGELIPKKESA